MKRFFENVKKYYKYAVYSAKAELKSEVANSYLNWVWWLLDPICFMLIYTFIVEIVFKTSEPYFPVFVFIGLTTWTFFKQMISGSVKLVSSNRSIVTKVYIPKYILLLSKSFKYLFKMMISFSLVIVLMLIFNVPFTIQILWFIPILIVLYVVSFGLGSILIHFGIYVEDLFNVVNIVLKLMFYLSGIFYNIRTRVPAPYNGILLRVNPAAFIMDEFRKILIDGKMPSLAGLSFWLFVGIILTMIGVKIIHKYENSYAKVI